MSRVTFAILLDALKYGVINPDDAPFLWSLQQQSLWGAMVEVFAFQTRPAFFAGLWPEESEVCHLFWYDPDNSPYRFTRYLPLPDWILRIPKLRGLVLRELRYVARRNERRRGHTASAAYAHPAQVPFRLLRYFAYSERYLTWEPHALPRPTLFDILREQELSWLWLGYPGQDQHTHSLLAAFQKQIRPDHRFVYLHFGELDWQGHRYGPESPQYRQTLQELDAAVARVYHDLSQMFDEVNGIIFGDHGMVSVQQLVDVEAALRETGLRVPQDYVYFLDSTQARFWFTHERARKVVSEALSALRGGHILQEDEIGRLHIRFRHQRFGEMFFVAEDNAMIFPNFFQRLKPVRGMHGYLPEVKDNWAHYIVIHNSDHRVGKMRQPIDMVDLFPTFLDLMQLPVPPGVHAQSVFRRSFY